MVLNLDKITADHEFELPTLKLGVLKCSSVKLKHLIELETYIKTSEPAGDAFARKLLFSIAQKVHDESLETEEAEKRDISVEDLQLVSPEEIELFAAQFIAHNKWMLHLNVEDETYDEHVFPQDSGETNSEYLLRFFQRYTKEQSRRLKDVMAPYRGLSKSFLKGFEFKSPLSDISKGLITKNMFHSDRLRELSRGFDALKKVKAAIPATIAPIYDPPHHIKIPENPTFETNRRLNDVLDHMDEMRPLVAESANLIGSMNNAAIQMIADFGRNARRTEIYTWFLIIMAVSSLAITAFFSWSNYELALQAKGENQRVIEKQSIQMINSAVAQEKRFQEFKVSLDAHAQRRLDTQRQQIKILLEAHSEGMKAQSDEDKQAFLNALETILNGSSLQNPPIVPAPYE